MPLSLPTMIVPVADETAAGNCEVLRGDGMAIDVCGSAASPALEPAPIVGCDLQPSVQVRRRCSTMGKREGSTPTSCRNKADLSTAYGGAPADRAD